ncbi:hypothetical protein [Streptomyces sp. NPDC001507]|uniref:hypothetical protein n=1 Tax=Streptomyces sp. NPDC001507 TaxID=3364579 RepID=UPI003678CE2B
MTAVLTVTAVIAVLTVTAVIAVLTVTAVLAVIAVIAVVAAEVAAPMARGRPTPTPASRPR